MIAQLLERRALSKQTHLPLTQSPTRSAAADGGSGYGVPLQWHFNFLRLLRLAAFACFMFAPLTKAWFELLVRLFPGEGLAVAFPRMALDQLCYAPFVLSTLFLWTGLLESGGSFHFAFEKMRSNVGRALRANWIVWPAVQLINQGVVPLEGRMLVAAIVNVPWTAYLASKAAAKTNTAVRHSASCNAKGSRSNHTDELEQAAQQHAHAKRAGLREREEEKREADTSLARCCCRCRWMLFRRESRWASFKTSRSSRGRAHSLLLVLRSLHATAAATCLRCCFLFLCPRALSQNCLHYSTTQFHRSSLDF